MTQRYAHLSPDHLANAANHLADFDLWMIQFASDCAGRVGAIYAMQVG